MCAWENDTFTPIPKHTKIVVLSSFMSYPFTNHMFQSQNGKIETITQNKIFFLKKPLSIHPIPYSHDVLKS